VDARSTLPIDYVERCAGRLQSVPSIGVVGGSQQPGAAHGVIRRGIARALGNRLALGGAKYRSRGASGPVDTVYLGTWRRRDLLELGGFDERLLANEDFELCARFRSHGFEVWMEQDLAVEYESRTTLRAVWSQYVAFGRSKVRFWRLTGRRPNARQLTALTAAGAAAAAVGAALVFTPATCLVAIPVAVTAIALVDHIGAESHSAAAPRAVAIATYPVIWGAWLGGVLVGLFETAGTV
jgi:hypothetical protein